jgi:hypothetical protein
MFGCSFNPFEVSKTIHLAAKIGAEPMRPKVRLSKPAFLPESFPTFVATIGLAQGW